MSLQRINPDNGEIEVGERGLFGTSWSSSGDRVNSESGEIENGERGLFGTSWSSSGDRINTESGEIESGEKGFFGTSWSSTGDRVNSESGEIEKGEYGFFGRTWTSTGERVNSDNGEIEVGERGLFGTSWASSGSDNYSSDYSPWSSTDDEDYDDDDDDDDDDDYDYSSTSEDSDSDSDEDEDEDEDEEEEYETNCYTADSDSEFLTGTENHNEVLVAEKVYFDQATLAHQTTSNHIYNSHQTNSFTTKPNVKIDAKLILQSGIDKTKSIQAKLVNFAIEFDNSGMVDFDKYLLISTEISNYFSQDNGFVNSKFNLKLFLTGNYKLIIADSNKNVLFNGVNNPNCTTEYIREVFENQIQFYYDSLNECIERKNQLIQNLSK